MNNLLFALPLLGFFVTIVVLPLWIRKSHRTGSLWEDMNKFNRPKNVAASGGIVVVMSFIICVLLYVAFQTFLIESSSEIITMVFALLGTISILAMVGLVDDMLGWKSGGLSTRARLILAFVASIPLVVINAGNSSMTFPFLGSVNLGLIYPLILIPLGIAGATTTYNFLAGFNGLESGQGILILSFLSFVAYRTGSNWLSLIGLIMVFCLIAFFIFNKYPAKVFPGDSLTWTIGALIAGMAILGNFERLAIFVFIPYILETLLKIRGGLKKQSFAKPNADGSLNMPYSKIYGLTHLSLFVLKKIKRKVYEKDVVFAIFIFQIIFILIGLLLI